MTTKQQPERLYKRSTGLVDGYGARIHEGDEVEYDARLPNSDLPQTVRQTVVYSKELAAYCLIGSKLQPCLLHAVDSSALTVVTAATTNQVG